MHQCINDDDRAVVVSPCRRGLLRKVRQDVGPDVAIRIVDNSQLPPELESNACPPRRSGGLVGARHNESLLLGQCDDGREGRCDKKRERNPAQPFNPSFSRQTAISRELIKFK